MSGESLRHRATDGIIWSAIDQFGQQGVRFFVGLILARLLVPEQFGVLAMVTVFVAIATIVTDSGFSQAIVQRKDISQSALSTVFFFNITIGFASASTIYLIAPLVAKFYSNDELIAILRVLSIGVVLSAFGQVHRAQLQRKLLFKRAVWASFPSTILAGLVGVLLAFNGWGLWALVAQMLVNNAMNSILLWVVSAWRPTACFSFESLGSLMPFGSRMAFMALINSIFSNIYVLFIGRFFSAGDVGYYQRAEAFKRMASANLNAVVGRVLFPLFSTIQDDPSRLRKVFLRSYGLLCFFFFPIMGILAGVSESMIVTLIGDAWLPSAFYLQLLCIVGAMFPLNSINVSVLKSIGLAGKLLKMSLVKRAITLLLLFVTFRFGIVAMIVGQIFASFFALWLNAYYTRIYLELTYFDQFKQAVWPAFLGVTACSFIFLVNSLMGVHGGGVVALIVSLFVGGSVVGIGFYFLRLRIKDELEYFSILVPASKPIIRWLYV